MVSLLSQSSNAAITSHFIIELRLLRILGVSLFEDEGIPYRIYSVVIISLMIILNIVLYGHEVTKHDLNDGLADIIVFESCAIMVGIKVAVLFRNRVKILELLAKLERKPFLPNPKRGGAIEVQLTKECLWITKAQRLTLLGSLFLVIGVILVITVIQRIKSSNYKDWIFPFGPLTVLNITYSPNYEITVLYQIVSALSMAPVYVTTDLLLAGLLVHVKYQFKILQNYIRQLVDAAGEEMNSRMEEAQQSSGSVEYLTGPTTISWKYLQKHLKKAVRYHSAILDLNEEVESIFNLLLLAQLFNMTSQLCLTIYGTSIETSNVQAAKYIGMFAIVALQVFLVGYWAEEVLHECQQVGQAAYETNFVGTDVRFQKALILIIRRSQSPWKITAGKFAVLSLATFTWILQTSYSAFSVLQATNTK